MLFCLRVIWFVEMMDYRDAEVGFQLYFINPCKYLLLLFVVDDERVG